MLVDLCYDPQQVLVIYPTSGRTSSILVPALLFIITRLGVYVVSYHNRYENDARACRVHSSVYVPPALREPRRRQHVYERLYIYSERRNLFGFRALK